MTVTMTRIHALIVQVLSILCILCCPPCHAWWEIPHMVTAEVAKLRLSPSVLRKVTMVTRTFTPFDRETVDEIASSAVWADLIKAHDFEAFNDWHYVDHPFRTDPSIPLPIVDPKNAVWALERARDVLKSNKNGPFGRGLMLRMLIHITGDMHQPLHSITRYTVEHPDGDLGGNFFKIARTHPDGPDNLHAFWDSGAGSFELPEGLKREDLYSSKGLGYIKQKALELIEEFPIDTVAKRITGNYSQWAEEAFELAKSTVYDEWTKTSNWDVAADVPEDYQVRAQKLTRFQVALGGYRLAAELASIYENIEPSPSFESPFGQAHEAGETWNTSTTVLLVVTAILSVVVIILSIQVRGKDNQLKALAAYLDQGHDRAERGEAHLLTQVERRDSNNPSVEMHEL